MRPTQDDTLEGIIEDKIKEELRYYRTYAGQIIVNVDPLGLGRVLCTVPELQWLTPDVGAWCYPRQVNAITTPRVGKWVEVAFFGASPDWPVYHGEITELERGLPSTYQRNPTSHVLFESPVQKANVVYDDITGLLSVKTGTLGLKVNSGSEQMIKGTSALIELNKSQLMLSTLQSALKAWVPVATDGGASLKAALSSFLTLPTPNYSAILSTIMRGE